MNTLGNASGIATFIKWTLMVYLFGLLNGCGSSKEGPSINMPKNLLWKENTEVSYQVDAFGEPPLTYQLLSSPDSQLFSIDSNTGLLASVDSLDYESPQDDNSDQIYELTIIVIDGNSKLESFNFSVEVEDVFDYRLMVTFPPPGSNVGGLESNFHVRGYIASEDGTRAERRPRGVNVKVGGITAQFSDAGTSDWSLEVPIQQGQNTLSITAESNSGVGDSEQLILDNNPIPEESSAVTDGREKIYHIDSTRQFLTQTEIATQKTTLLLSLDDLRSIVNCEALKNIALSPNGDTLAIYCGQRSIYNSGAILSLSISNSQVKVIEPNFYGGRIYGWANDELLVFDGNEADFSVINMKTMVVGYFEVKSPIQILDVDIAGDSLYVSTGNNEGYSLSHFNIAEEMAAYPLYIEELFANGFPVNQHEAKEVQLISSDIDLAESYEFKIYDGALYTIEAGDIYKTSLIDNSSNKLEVDFFIGSKTPNRPKPERFVSVNSDWLVLRNTIGQALIRVAQNDLRSELIFKRPSLLSHESHLSLDPNNNSMISFDFRNQKYTRFSLPLFDMELTQDFSRYYNLNDFIYSYIDYDWSSHTLFQSIVYNWGGIPQDNQTHILALDIETGLHKTLLTGDDLASYMGMEENAQYKVGQLSFINDVNQLWFSLNASDGANRTEGIYSYDLATGSIQTIKEVNVPQADYIVGDFISSFDPASHQVILTHWLQGYTQTVNTLTGDIVKINNPEVSGYMTSWYSDIDALSKRIFTTAFYDLDSSGNIGSKPSSLIVLDLEADTQTELASQDIGYGIPLLGVQPIKYDELRDLIYTPYHGYLKVIDPQSGDRVIMSVH